MRRIALILIAVLTASAFGSISSQNSIQLSEIDLVNLGDGQLYGHKRDEAKTPLEGKTRIITGFTTEYIDAEFAKGGMATGKWEYYSISGTLTREEVYEKGVEKSSTRF